jgi:hypothetical protein
VTPAWWLRAVCGVAPLITGLRVLSLSGRLLRRGRHRCADVIDSFDSLHGTRYVLYLRPFANDVTMAALFFPSRLTQEEALVQRFARFGRVVAIGRPGELLPPVGAVRGQLPLDDWHGPVSRLIAGAHVVLMAAGPGPGTVWEFTEAVRLLEPTRLVLLIYCDAETYDRFRKAVASEHKRRSITEPEGSGGPQPPLPLLPDYPGLARPERRRWDFVLKGVIVFAPDWTASFTRFDATTRRLPAQLATSRLVGREFQPVIAQLDGLAPPRRPPSGTDLPE